MFAPCNRGELGLSIVGIGALFGREDPVHKIDLRGR